MIARLYLFALLLVPLAAIAPAQTGEKPITPLLRAHAHNDYQHKRPLRDALDQGFRSVEADVYLSKDSMLVAHLPWELKPERTLEKLYLDPLRERAKANNGKIYPDGPPFYLLIDVKSEAKKTYAALATALEKYADVLSVTKDGQFEQKAVTVVVSGNCDREAITRQTTRYAAIDGRPGDLDGNLPAHLVPWVSESWGSLFKWDGGGPMPDVERTKLKEFVAKAHKHGRMVRFWGTPDKVDLWRELLAADVDLINTDKLAELRSFLFKEK